MTNELRMHWVPVVDMRGRTSLQAVWAPSATQPAVTVAPILQPASQLHATHAA